MRRSAQPDARGLIARRDEIERAVIVDVFRDETRRRDHLDRCRPRPDALADPLASAEGKGAENARPFELDDVERPVAVDVGNRKCERARRRRPAATQSLPPGDWRRHTCAIGPSSAAEPRNAASGSPSSSRSAHANCVTFTGAPTNIVTAVQLPSPLLRSTNGGASPCGAAMMSISPSISTSAGQTRATDALRTPSARLASDRRTDGRPAGQTVGRLQRRP